MEKMRNPRRKAGATLSLELQYTLSLQKEALSNHSLSPNSEISKTACCLNNAPSKIDNSSGHHQEASQLADSLLRKIRGSCCCE
jgi:hypothetical protein